MLTIYFSYGSPGHQLVTEKFEIKWATYLTSFKNIICVFTDARGSGGRGDSFMHSVYKNLGTVQVEDTIIAGE